MDKIGDRLKKIREQKGYSQRDIAAILGVSRSAVGNWEQGAREPDRKTIQRLSELYDVTSDYLIGITDDPMTHEEFNRKLEEGKKMFELAMEAKPELVEFWKEAKDRQDLQLLMIQAAKMNPDDIRDIIGYLRLLEARKKEQK